MLQIPSAPKQPSLAGVREEVPFIPIIFQSEFHEMHTFINIRNGKNLKIRISEKAQLRYFPTARESRLEWKLEHVPKYMFSLSWL